MGIGEIDDKLRDMIKPVYQATWLLECIPIIEIQAQRTGLVVGWSPFDSEIMLHEDL